MVGRVQQLVEDPAHEPRRPGDLGPGHRPGARPAPGPPFGGRRDPGPQPQGRGRRPPPGGGGEVAVALHPGQHRRPPGPGGPGVPERVVGRRRPDHPGQQGRLGQGQPGGPGREVGLGGRLHPVGPLAEVHGVEVGLEDRPLGVAPLQAPGVPGLGQLAPQGPLAGDVGVLDVLLGDGRPALDHPPVLQVPGRRPRHRQPVHPAVAPEPRVLGVHHRHPHPPADLLQRHRRPVLRPVQRRQPPTPRVQHQRRLRHPFRRHQLQRPHRHTPGQPQHPGRHPRHHPGPSEPTRRAPCTPEPHPPIPGPPNREGSPAAHGRSSVVHSPRLRGGRGGRGVAHGKVNVGIRGGRLHSRPC